MKITADTGINRLKEHGAFFRKHNHQPLSANIFGQSSSLMNIVDRSIFASSIVVALVDLLVVVHPRDQKFFAIMIVDEIAAHSMTNCKLKRAT